MHKPYMLSLLREIRKSQKFNLTKWEAIQERHNALRATARKNNDDWLECREIYQRSFAIFQNDYRDVGALDKSGPLVFDVIRADAKLSLAAIDEHLALMESDWLKAADRLNVAAGFTGKDRILKIYAQMRQMKKFQEASERANAARSRYGAAFNVLNDFARKFNFDEKGGLFPVAEAPNPYGNYGAHQSVTGWEGIL